MGDYLYFTELARDAERRAAGGSGAAPIVSPVMEDETPRSLIRNFIDGYCGGRITDERFSDLMKIINEYYVIKMTRARPPASRKVSRSKKSSKTRKSRK
jgi:hypothetical protein